VPGRPRARARHEPSGLGSPDAVGLACCSSAVASACVLWSAGDAAVVVVVAKVPLCEWVDGLATSPAHCFTSCYHWCPRCTDALVTGAVPSCGSTTGRVGLTQRAASFAGA
jgi:hypothetical protein